MAVLLLGETVHAEGWQVYRCDGDQRMPLLGSDGRHLLVEEHGTAQPAAVDAAWRVDDAIRAAATEVFWLCDRSARFVPPPTGGTDREHTIRIDASLRHGWGLNAAGKMTDGELIASWPGNLRQPAAAVFLWVIGERVVAVDVRPVPSTQTCPAFCVRVSRLFTPDEADRCRVGVAWVCDGKILAPTPGFSGAGAAQLATALAFDDPTALTQALKQGASLAAVDRDGIPLFCRAALLGADQVVTQMLQLDNGLSDVCIPSASGKSALALAAASGRSSVVRALLRGGAQPRGSSAKTPPLHVAAAYGHADIVQSLLDAGAPVNAVSPGGIPWTPMEAAIMAGSESVVRMLAARGATLPADPRLARLLIEAAEKGQVELVGWLLQHGSRSALRLGGDLALAAAAREATPAIVAVLAGAGAKGDVVQGPDSSDQGETALTIASRRGRSDFVAELLAHGAAINSRNAQKQNALHVAAAANRADVVRLLLSRGADPALTDIAHATALDLAVLGSSPEAAAALVPNAAFGGNNPAARDRVLEAAIAQDLVDVVVALTRDAPVMSQPLLGGWSASALADTCGATKVAAVLHEKFGVGGSSPVYAEAKTLDRPPVLKRSTPIAGTNVPGRRTLRVAVVIDPEGRIRVPHFVERPTVDDSGAILGALAGWRFVPPTRQGQPVATRVVLPLQVGAEGRSFFDINTVDDPPVLLNGGETMFPDPTGSLEITVVVNEQGTVREARVSGPKPEHPCLAKVRQWRFSPARHKGVPAAVSMVVRVAGTP